MARRRGKRGVKAEFVGPKITVPRATGGVLGVKNRCAPCYGGYFFIRAHFFASEPGGLVGVLKIKNQCARGYRGCFEGQKSVCQGLQGVFSIDGFFFCINARGYRGCFEDKKSVCPVLRGVFWGSKITVPRATGGIFHRWLIFLHQNQGV